MPTTPSRKPFLFAAALLAAVSIGHAEPVQVRPGLWAQAFSLSINGKPMRMPNVGDGPAAEEFRRIQQAAKQFGLPEGWQPSLSCQRESSVDARELIAKETAASGCKYELLEQRRDGGRFSARCQTPDGVAQGTGEVTVVNGTEARFSSKGNMVMRGQTVTMESQSISKWVGPDCQHPPAGIDPSWVGHE